MDWRDAQARLELTTPETELDPVLATVERGGRVMLVRPLIGEGIEWSAPWTELVRRRSAEWGRALAEDRRFRKVAVFPRRYPDELPRGVRVVLYERTR